MKYILFLALLLISAHGFTFLYPFVTPTSVTISTLTSYNFVAHRQFDINLGNTPYKTQLVPAGSTITVIFPS